MKLEKAHLVKLGIFMFILLIFLPGMYGIRQETTSYSGVIDRIDKDSKSVVVNGAKFLISPNTSIVDEKGNRLKANDLKPKISVIVEGAHGPEGFSAKKIIVTNPKKKP